MLAAFIDNACGRGISGPLLLEDGLRRMLSARCTPRVAVTSLTLDRRGDSRSECMCEEKFFAKNFVRRKKFMLLCRTVSFKNSHSHGNRAQHKRRIPQ
jgi:hypothetical protein